MSHLPLVSVVIPMRNEAGHIGACIDAVLAQDYPAECLELIVVDGESDDDSARVLGRYGARVRVLPNPSRIVPTAMNIGIGAARGEIIARIDAHTVIAPDYMRVGVATLQRTRADNAGGAMHAVGGGSIGDAIALATASRFGIGSYFHFGREEAEVDTVYMGMYPRAVFERVGLFDEEMVRNQDDEFNYRLRKAGGRIVLTPAMRSAYQNRQTLGALAKQYVQYGFWKVRVLQKHPRQMSVRHFVPPAFVLSLALLLGLLPGTPWWLHELGLLAAAAVALYALLVTLVSVRLAWEAGRPLLGPLLAVFVTLHVAWGAGFVVGLVRFAARWFTAEPPPPKLLASVGDLRWSGPAIGG